MAAKRKETEAMRRSRLAKGREQIDPSDIAQRYIVITEGQYSVAFPRHLGNVSKGPVQLRTLEQYPGIAQALAEGYTLHGVAVASADRRYYIWQGLKTGFLKFLAFREGGTDIRLDQIDESLLKEFKGWLDDPSSEGFSPKKITRRAKIQELQLVLRQLMNSPKWAPQLSPDLKLIDNLYPNASREIEHTDILDDAALEVLYVAAVTDCEAIIKRCREEQARLASLTGRVVTLAEAGRDAFHCAAYMLANFELPLPPHSTLIRMSVEYGRAISADTYAAMQRLLYPDTDELLPFILLLTVMFAFNPGVVLNMTHDDYEEEQLFGRERIRLKPFKPRAHRNQVSTVLATDDPDNPRTIFKHLKDRCARVRGLVEIDYSDRVFLRFSPALKGGTPFINADAMRDAIARFCTRHQFDPFHLRQIRPTTLDLVHEITGGNLLAMQQVAHHRDPETTMTYYTGSAFKRRSEEMLAAGMEHYARKVRTSGAIDPTTRHRLQSDLAAATPGFACLDPMDSPMPGERKGASCGAYGRCPICPLAMIDPQSAQAFAYLIKLRDALDEAAGRLGAAWLARWAPVKEKVLTLWVPLFRNESVRRRGAEMAELTTPSLPPLD